MPEIWLRSAITPSSLSKAENSYSLISLWIKRVPDSPRVPGEHGTAKRRRPVRPTHIPLRRVPPGQMVTLFGEGARTTNSGYRWNGMRTVRLGTPLAGVQVLFDGTTSIVVQYARAIRPTPLVLHVAPNVANPFTKDLGGSCRRLPGECPDSGQNPRLVTHRCSSLRPGTWEREQSPLRKAFG